MVRYVFGDKGAIISDPNQAADERYIVRLLAQVITVSLETVQIVAALQGLG